MFMIILHTSREAYCETGNKAENMIAIFCGRRTNIKQRYGKWHLLQTQK